jgi:hypothetical protein
MKTERLSGRVARLRAQMERCAGKIRTRPADPRVEAWKARWLECQESLKNLRDHGSEAAPLRPAGAGVEIEVPTAPFAVERQAEG